MDAEPDRLRGVSAEVSVADSGLAAALSRTTSAVLTDPARGAALFGTLLEGFVVGELAKQRTRALEPFEMFHWRDRNDKKVDVVLEFNDALPFGPNLRALSVSALWS